MNTFRKYTTIVASLLMATSGISSVIAADVVSLTNGATISMPAGTKAVLMDAVLDLSNPDKQGYTTEEILKNSMYSKTDKSRLQEVNSAIRDAINNVKILGAENSAKDFKGKAVNGVKVYQLQGTNAQGYQIATLWSIGVDKELINYVMNSAGVGIVGSSTVDVLTALSGGYSKEIVEFGMSFVPSKVASASELKDMNNSINNDIHQSVLESIDQSLIAAKEKGMPAEEVELYKGIAKRLVPLGTIELTSLAAGPYENSYGTLMTLNGRGNVSYDGVKIPGALSLIAEPTASGISLNYIFMDDSSYDYWQNQIANMWQYKPLKGGK